MYNTYTQKKQNVLNDEERKLKRESIIKKNSGEPQWVKDITKGVLADNESAITSGIAKNIAQTDSNLTRWDNELNQLNQMTRDRKEQEHIKSFVAGLYPRVKVNSPINLEPNGYVDISGESTTSGKGKSILDAVMKNRSALPQNTYSRRLPLVQKILEESKEKYGFNYGNQKSDKEEFLEAIQNIDSKDSKNEFSKYITKKEENNPEEDYKTKPDDDFSETYGTTIKRKDEDTDLGNDTKKSREKASEIIVKYKDTIIGMGEKYGVNPAILASVIFTEQACNIGTYENIKDELGKNFKKTVSVGPAQVQINTAIDLENDGYIQPPIKQYTVNGIKIPFCWVIPGVDEKFEGTYQMAVAARASDPIQNIEYAAAYLANIRDLWKGAYSKIDGDTAISATLYNIGKTGTKGIHSNPGTNDFGRYARANYYYMESLLGWSAK